MLALCCCARAHSASTDDDLQPYTQQHDGITSQLMAPTAVVEGDCPICLQAFTARTVIYKTDCGHVYCSTCLVKTLNLHSATSQHKCAICRASVRHSRMLQNPQRHRRFSTASKQQRPHVYLPSDLSSNYQADNSFEATDDLLVIQIRFNRVNYDTCIPIDITLRNLKIRLASLFQVDAMFMKLSTKGQVLFTDEQLWRILYNGIRNNEPGVYVVFNCFAVVNDTGQANDKTETDGPLYSHNCVIS